jgi:hypothetical protein
MARGLLGPRAATVEVVEPQGVKTRGWMVRVPERYLRQRQLTETDHVEARLYRSTAGPQASTIAGSSAF